MVLHHNVWHNCRLGQIMVRFLTLSHMMRATDVKDTLVQNEWGTRTKQELKSLWTQMYRKVKSVQIWWREITSISQTVKSLLTTTLVGKKGEPHFAFASPSVTVRKCFLQLGKATSSRAKWQGRQKQCHIVFASLTLFLPPQRCFCLLDIVFASLITLLCYR